MLLLCRYQPAACDETGEKQTPVWSILKPPSSPNPKTSQFVSLLTIFMSECVCVCVFLTLWLSVRVKDMDVHRPV